jgi:Condensation domain/TubC N-terminal docking domain
MFRRRIGLCAGHDIADPAAAPHRMTSVAQLIAGLESRGILLSLAGEDIRYRSPKDALTEDDRGNLRAHRTAILDYLKTRAAARALKAAGATQGPLTSSVAQEMWWRFAGGAEEGKPVALNIGMVGKFRHDAAAVTTAIHKVIARYDALRARFESQGEKLTAFLNSPGTFEVEQEEADGDAAARAAQQFCSRLNVIEGTWLTRAKVFSLPGGESLAAISSAHMIADAGTRNIVLDEIRDILDHGAPQAVPSTLYNDYSLAEQDCLAGPQGAQLIGHWRDWYREQPMMKAPSGAPLLWGNGIRAIKSFTMPGRVRDKVVALADSLKVTPFLVYLTIFSIAMARWAGMERFPLRVLGDKRGALDLSNTVGLMFCADALEINVPARAEFERVMRGILTEYDASLSLRIPSLHFWAPHAVMPGIEPHHHENKIPAVFNYYSVGTAREKAERRAMPDGGAALPWPPQITTITQTWPRRSSPLFLHVNDQGHDVQMALHFFQEVVSPAEQDSFTHQLFQVFAETVPA